MAHNKILSVGQNIVRFRKERGWTQVALANRLFISDKTVSKWELGLGNPDIAMLSKLAELFNISMEQLLFSENQGITIAGSILTDNIKIIDAYPEKGMLSDISDVSNAVGGCVPNTIIDLARIDRSIPLCAVGRVGDDENGRYALLEMQKYGIDVKNVKITQSESTGFSDVMTIAETGERTFFHHRGANRLFTPQDILPKNIKSRLLHIGYILLLDAFDAADPEYGTVMASFLASVREHGIKTSIDVVSMNLGCFVEKVVPALRYCNYAIMNEIEGCSASGLSPRNADGTINQENIQKTMKILMSYGVEDMVIIHCPEAGFLLNKAGEIYTVPSYELPIGFIKGCVGAGDAFCAGCLYGIYNGFSENEILEFASAAAAFCLSKEDSVSGMQTKEEIIKWMKSQKRCKIN